MEATDHKLIFLLRELRLQNLKFKIVLRNANSECPNTYQIDYYRRKIAAVEKEIIQNFIPSDFNYMDL